MPHSASRIRSIRTDELESFYTPVKDCLHQPLPEALGTGYTDFYLLDQDLSYIETRYKSHEDLAVINKADFHEPKMVVTLTLQGQSSFKSRTGLDILFSEGYTTITSFNSSMGERLYEANKETTQLRFSLSKRWVDRHLDEDISNRLFAGPSACQIGFRPLSLQSAEIARQLLRCGLNGKLKRLYIQGQAMILLANELNYLMTDRDADPERINLRDSHIAHLARNILLREFKQPPSVSELAARAGTNQCKLKQLFHHFFNTTPYGMLLDIRMKIAYELLESTDCQVSQAADAVGYRHLANFSSAFVKYFGFSPKYIRYEAGKPRIIRTR